MSGGSKKPGGIPGPIVYARSQASPGPVTFRHGSHLRGPGGCASCHPETFSMKALAMPVAAMHERTGCGKCHNGTSAFGIEVPEQCPRSHVSAKGTP